MGDIFLTLSRTADKIRRLMPTDLSQSLNPLRLAKAGERLEGDIQLDSMERITDMLLEHKGLLHYCLAFGVDDSGIHFIESEIRAQLLMKCQRCLESVTIDIDKQTMLGIVKNKEEAESLATKYEPFFLDDGEFNLKEFVEDELLLAIPFSPLHSEEQCSGTMELDRINAESKINPFAALASLKKDKN